MHVYPEPGSTLLPRRSCAAALLPGVQLATGQWQYGCTLSLSKMWYPTLDVDINVSILLQNDCRDDNKDFYQ